MKLYLKKSNCDFDESVNGEVMIVETFEPILVEEDNCAKILHSQWDNDFGPADEPYLTNMPRGFQL